MYIKGEIVSKSVIFLLEPCDAVQNNRCINFNTPRVIKYSLYFETEEKALEALDYIALGIRNGDKLVDLTSLQGFNNDT
jgi:hypothetical protein